MNETKVKGLVALIVMISLTITGVAVGGGIHTQWFTQPHEPCCVDENANIWQIVQWTQCGRFSCWQAWDLYYHVYQVIPSNLAQSLVGTNGTVTVRCNYFHVGMNFTLNRNIQPSLPINWFGIAANGTAFVTIMSPQIHGC